MATRLATLTAAVDLEALAARVEAVHAEYLNLARELSAGWQRVAGEMGAAVSALMQQLALASGRFEVALLPLAEGAAHGLEQVEFRVGGLRSSTVHQQKWPFLTHGPSNGAGFRGCLRKLCGGTLRPIKF